MTCLVAPPLGIFSLQFYLEEFSLQVLLHFYGIRFSIFTAADSVLITMVCEAVNKMYDFESLDVVAAFES